MNNENQSGVQNKSFKCANCGNALESFSAYCPACGHELRGISSSESLISFIEKLEEINSRKYQKVQTNSLLKKVIGKDLNNDELHAEINFEKAKKQEKIALIKEFPIPNTKEDIQEFAILASSNVNIKEHSELSQAWFSKLEQAYEKANLSFEQEQTETVKSIYYAKKEALENENFKNFLSWILPMAGVAYVIITLLTISLL